MMEDTFTIEFTNVDALQAEKKRLRKALELIDRHSTSQYIREIATKALKGDER